MNTQAKKNAQWLGLAALIIVLDLGTKAYFSANYYLGESLPIIPGLLSWTLAHNYGAAFSFLAEAGGWQRWFFGVIAVGVSIPLTVWLLKLPANAKWLACSLVLIIGGAIGNCYDRVTLGYVVDFIHVYYGDWHFPVFNIADCGITVGAIMLIIDSIFFEKKREAANG